MTFVVYMLRCADGTFYVGWTKDVEARIHAHNHLKSGAKYTKARRPVELAYKETHPTLSAALKREWALKQLKREEKLALTSSFSSLS